MDSTVQLWYDRFMKKLLLGALFLFPFLTNAQVVAFTSDMHYGSTGPEVVALQEFLHEQGVFTGNATGNFYSITLKAVKDFQRAEGITPISGFVGPITRGVINGILSEQAPVSEGDATTTKPVVDLSIPTPVSGSVPPPIQEPVVQPTVQPEPQVIPIQDNSTTCTLSVAPIPNKSTVEVSWVTQNATKGTVYYFNGTIAAGVKQYDKLVDMVDVASSSFKGASPNDFKAIVQPGNVTCYISSNN